MRGPKPTPIELSERQSELLERILRRHSSCQQLVKRVQLIQTMAAGNNNQQAADITGVTRETAIRWRCRWLMAVEKLTAAEIARVSDRELMAMIEEVVTDEPRCGAPMKFSAEQLTQIIAIACSDPNASECPISHWSSTAIMVEAIERGIVENISLRSVQRFLKRSRLKTAPQPILVKCKT
ncbi:helix-turn-helix domain-containing protein [Scytonema sp. PCC 10023]|uniref:helix-turn-helix domain-containing protein n=1 Tax=Scytonema sp. PCC 10023 TaxID=1680591 RepID=UPI0039C6A8B6